MAQDSSPQFDGEQENRSTTTSDRVGVYSNSTPASTSASTATDSGRVGVYDRPATRLSTLSGPMLFGLLVLILVLAAVSFIVFRAIF
jgi:hypothetical protein